MSKSERVTLRVRGTVQGVGFRAHATERASVLGLTGWVRNEDDGSVTVVAEGPPQTLDRFEDWVREGPDAAAVEAVDAKRSPATGEFSEFGQRAE